MLEWSIRKLKEQTKTCSLSDAYDDLVCQNHDWPGYSNFNSYQKELIIAANNTPQISSIKEMRDYLNVVAEDLGLKNIKLIAQKSTPQTWEELNHSYAEYRKLRTTFLKFIGFHNREACLNLGLTELEIELLQKGIAPENYCVHLKIPFDFGGSAEINNLALLRSHPVHDNFHTILDKQLQSGFIKHNKIALIPWFEGRLYYG